MKRSTVLWRFRRNPLRRRSYAVEGFALLTLGAVAIAGAALTGLAVSRCVDAMYAQQRQDRHTVTAVLDEDADSDAAYAAPSWARVHWPLPGGGSATGTARVGSGLRRGERTTIWLDGRGRPAAEPLSPSTGRLQATVAGAAAGLGICAGALIGGGIAAAALERRRIGRWATEWAQVGPRWDHRNA
ncbi:Rv1733c family protein [Actinacidiphila bryophytorum]|nr:hypothetical protein [Actinacidiphila bryophytorum]MBM9437071.1 hypothetical protein [Actinacidiphila bryophytorum]MBN6544167.1 hypothetical protein [Actinacidiphila bryophytorum]